MKKIYSFLGLALVAGFISAQVNVTYQVDITNYLAGGATLSANGIRIGGNFTTNGAALPDWTPSDPACAMTDLGGNIWSITVTYPSLSIGDTQLFKFVNGDWGTNEGTDTSGIATGGCGLDDGAGNINRIMIIPGQDMGLQFCWEECTRCDGSSPVLTAINEVNNFSEISITPNPAIETTQINYTLNTAAYVKIDIYNATGQLVNTVLNENENSGSHLFNLNVADMQSGLYLVNINTDGSSIVRSLIVK